MAKSVAKAKPSIPAEIICEPGRHVGCLHAKMAERRAAAKQP
jgi:hypothetical protein